MIEREHVKRRKLEQNEETNTADEGEGTETADEAEETEIADEGEETYTVSEGVENNQTLSPSHQEHIDASKLTGREHGTVKNNRAICQEQEEIMPGCTCHLSKISLKDITNKIRLMHQDMYSI